MINDELVTKLSLNEEQVSGIKEFYESSVAELKKQYDTDYSGKANENAEKIIDGALSAVFGATRVEREKGEKVADYFNRVKSIEIDGKKAELEEKLKNTKGDEVLKKSYEEAIAKLDESQAKIAQYETSYVPKEDFEKVNQEYFGMKTEVAFNSVRPNFPDTVNKYELNAKWNEFKKGILDEFTIELVDGESIAISKENKHKQIKLSDLVAKDSNIQGLLDGRKIEGLGSKPESFRQVEGVPFKVPEGADSKVRADLIRKHLTEQGINAADPRYASRFAELNAKLLKAA